MRAGLLLVSLVLPAALAVASNAANPQRRTPSRPANRRPAVPRPRINYAEFSHATHVTNQKLSCASCHTFPTKNWKEVRKADAAFPDVAEFPEHAACINCHRPQFFARERPAPAICSNCHVNVTPRHTARFLFPSLGDVTESKLKSREFVSEFAIGFPHDKHIDVVGQTGRPKFVNVTWNESQESAQSRSCRICHQLYQPQGKSSEEYVTKPPSGLGDNFWLKKGTFQTGPNSHTTCFTCHSPDGIPPEPRDCQGCHALVTSRELKVDFDPRMAAEMGVTDQTLLQRASSRMSAGAFRHEGGMHPELNCTGCHNISRMNTLEPVTLKVPVQSCGGAEGCHITATSDEGGALNFEVDKKKSNAGFVCTKCHVTFGKEGVPVSHSQAVATAKK